MGTIESWLLWQLTAGEVHATDYSNASRTMLYNIRQLDWDDELLGVLDIPRQMLPPVVPSSAVLATTARELFDGARIPISGIAGDQQAALFGQACYGQRQGEEHVRHRLVSVDAYRHSAKSQ